VPILKYIQDKTQIRMRRNKSLYLLIIIILFSSCTDKQNGNEGDDKFIDSLFTPPMQIEIDQLLKEGYTKVDSLGLINKNTNDALVSYIFLNDHEPVYLRQVVKLNIDSSAVEPWIRHNGGQVVSTWENSNSNEHKFFVRDSNSALLLTGKYMLGNLVITFVYPDIGNQIRSKHRTVRLNDSIEIKGRMNDGSELTFSPF
jgi:hypothetical protein